MKACPPPVRTSGSIPRHALLLALVALFLAGCGYRLRDDPGMRFSDPGIVVDLRPFANASLVPDAGAFLAGRLREELAREGFRGRFARGGADFIVEGTVRSVQEELVSRGADQYGLGYRLTLTVDVRVLEVARGRLVWKEEGMSESAPFFAGADFQYTESNRRMAFEETCRQMARRIGQTLRLLL
ncbi:MAG: LPS assembly lipoprotein LptE [Gemmatimonadota bacterium]